MLDELPFERCYVHVERVFRQTLQHLSSSMFEVVAVVNMDLDDTGTDRYEQVSTKRS